MILVSLNKSQSATHNMVIICYSLLEYYLALPNAGFSSYRQIFLSTGVIRGILASLQSAALPIELPEALYAG